MGCCRRWAREQFIFRIVHYGSGCGIRRMYAGRRMYSLVQQSVPHGACAHGLVSWGLRGRKSPDYTRLTAKVKTSNLQDFRERVQCCGGGVRLRGSARGPPRVDATGIRCSSLTLFSTASAHESLGTADKRNIQITAFKAPTSLSLVGVCASKRHSTQPHCSPITKGHITKTGARAGAHTPPTAAALQTCACQRVRWLVVWRAGAGCAGMV
jgi:hypothetical protein